MVKIKEDRAKRISLNQFPPELWIEIKMMAVRNKVAPHVIMAMAVREFLIKASNGHYKNKKRGR